MSDEKPLSEEELRGIESVLTDSTPLNYVTAARLIHSVRRLRDAIKEHWAQRAEDRCWLDDDALYAAAGLPPCDFRVGDKAEMLKNCERFLANRCASGGPWKSYRELEEENGRLRASQADAVRAEREACAKICDVARREAFIKEIIKDADTHPGAAYELGRADEAFRLADAIRARGA